MVDCINGPNSKEMYQNIHHYYVKLYYHEDKVDAI